MPPSPSRSRGGEQRQRQVAGERRDDRDVAHEAQVAGAEEDAVEGEQHAVHRHHRDEPGPQHAGLVAHGRIAREDRAGSRRASRRAGSRRTRRPSRAPAAGQAPRQAPRRCPPRRRRAACRSGPGPRSRSSRARARPAPTAGSRSGARRPAAFAHARGDARRHREGAEEGERAQREVARGAELLL